ncbi:MAG: retropepsin-like aspartic protease [Acidobacteriota bacterium]
MQMNIRFLSKNKYLALLLILFFTQQAFSVTTAELQDLYDQKQYFDLRDKLREFQNDQSNEVIFFRGAIANKFNSPQESIALLNRFLKNASPKDERLKDCYLLFADNYAKTFQYAKAAESYQTLLRKFSGEMDGKDKADYENGFRLWNTLRKVRPQKVWFQGDSRIQGVKAEVGLTVPVEINRCPKEYLIFDTGANLSVVTESLAKKLNLQIIEARIDVGGITGVKTRAKLAVAKKLKLGNVLAENVVFLVFPDKALYIEPISYQMTGFIGFPLIAALREITWVKNQKILIPAKPPSRTAQNLALNNLTPLIEGHYQGKRLIFGFDTGASNTSFYQPFFKAFEDDVIRKGTQKPEKISGVGGSKEIKAYLMKDIKIYFAGKEATFPTVKVLTEKTTDLSQYVYGNIGRDLVDQFEKMTMNFQSMSVAFE